MTPMRVYLDYNATTPLHPDVLATMTPFLSERFGNPHSTHAWGREARQAVDAARQIVADALGAQDRDCVVFTGSGSEADNFALQGVLGADPGRPKHCIVSAVEHHAVLRTADYLERRGCAVTRLAVDRQGSLDPEDVRGAIRADTALVSIMHSNNETGVVLPIPEIARICRERGVPLHTDAIQSFGKVPLDVTALDVDLLSISGHKIYGPKGVGALYIRPGTRMVPLIHGGSQERSRRAGTENLASIVGLARAAELMQVGMEGEARRVGALRDRLEEGLTSAMSGVLRNGHPEMRLPHVSNLAFSGIEAESLILALDLHGIGASSGAACSSGSVELSHVLVAMGLSPERVRGSVRFSLGRGTTAEAIDYVLATLPPIATRIRRARGPRLADSGKAV
jgi:cysteine desulfurase